MIDSATRICRCGPIIGGRFRYGIPGSDRRGFKIADDTRGPAFDPTNGERVVSPETLKRHSRICRLPLPCPEKRAAGRDSRLPVRTDSGQPLHHRSPSASWKTYGSWAEARGTGFKHGPAIGEMVAELILNDREPDAFWRLARFTKR